MGSDGNRLQSRKEIIMTKQTKKTTTTQSPVDVQGFQDVFKTMGEMNERMAAIAIEAGTRATDVAHETTKKAISNMRELTQLRNDPAEYGKAFADFAQKQSELMTRTAQTFATETQKVGTEASELASKAGEEISTKVTESAETAAKTATSAASKAA